MWSELLGMLIRRALFLILGSALVQRFLGPDIVRYLLGDGVVAQIVTAVGTLLLILWSFRERILVRLRLKAAIAAPPRTSIQTIKADVAAQPIAEKLSLAFSDERKRG